MRVLAALALPKEGPQEYRTVIDTLIGMQWPEFSVIRLLTVLPARVSEEDKTRAADALEIVCQALEREISHCELQFELLTGDPCEAILEVAEGWGAEVIFVGSKKLSSGLRGIKLLFAGSVSQSVMMQARCPVFVLKNQTETDDEVLQQGFQSVLVPVDGSPRSYAKLKWIASLDWAPQTRFKVVTAVTKMVEELTTRDDIERARFSKLPTLTAIAMGELEEMAEVLVTKFGAERVTTLLQDGDPREIILDLAEDWHADLIVISSHGHSGLRRMLMGSVCQAVVSHAPCSVAVVRGLTEEAEDDGEEPDLSNIIEQPYNRTDFGDYRPQIHPGGM